MLMNSVVDSINTNNAHTFSPSDSLAPLSSKFPVSFFCFLVSVLPVLVSPHSYALVVLLYVQYTVYNVHIITNINIDSLNSRQRRLTLSITVTAKPHRLITSHHTTSHLISSHLINPPHRLVLETKLLLSTPPPCPYSRT